MLQLLDSGTMSEAFHRCYVYMTSMGLGAPEDLFLGRSGWRGVGFKDGRCKVSGLRGLRVVGLRVSFFAPFQQAGLKDMKMGLRSNAPPRVDAVQSYHPPTLPHPHSPTPTHTLSHPLSLTHTQASRI
jgi:hypothetical protein